MENLSIIEKPKCRRCNSATKKSKAFVNFHYLREKGYKEFQTKLIDCNKCINCGHSFT